MMKREAYENRKQFLSAGIWSLAVLAVIAVGMLTLFSAASGRGESRTQDPSVSETEGVSSVSSEKNDAESASQPDDDGTEAGWFKPANPLDTEIIGETPETAPEETPSPTETDGQGDRPVSTETHENFVCNMPVNGTVTKAFTDDIAVYSLTMNDYRVHNGIDIDAPIGTNVTACAAGVVERVWEDPFWGNCITVNHGGGICSTYANLSPELPRGMEAGATVLAGDIIGGIGESMIIEMADSDHLHFTVSVNGVYVDPTDYMPNYTK